jgi:FAD/FMN-containing dehydrogenase
MASSLSNKDTPLTLPPGVSADTFASYLARARKIVGDANVAVVTGPHQFIKDDYMDPAKEHDMFPVLDKDYFIASATVAPRNVPEVQELMRLSNALKVPVWPFSIGRNIGYGGAAPRVPGSVGLDMGMHMDKVIEVNEKDAYALVEPGVTFQGLYEHLVKTGLGDKLWIDVPDLGGGSVIGNTIERGVGYTPYGDHFMVGTVIHSAGLTSC